MVSYLGRGVRSPIHLRFEPMQFADVLLAFIARPLEAQEERKEHGVASKRLHMTGRDMYLSVTIFPSGLKIHCVYSCLGRQQRHAHSQVGLPVDCSSTHQHRYPLSVVAEHGIHPV